MKLKVSTVMLVGLVACSLAGFAQDKSTVPQDGTTAAGVSAVPQAGNAAQPAAAADAAQSGVAASQAAAPVADGTTAPAEPAAPAATATPTEGTAQAPDAATAAPAQPADSTAQPQAGAGNNNAPATTDQAQTPAANPNTSAAQAPAAPAQQSESGTPDQADASKPPANAAQAEDSTVVRAKDTPPAGSANGTNAPAQPGAVIPLIVMDDVPLTDAIKNLARQAGLNHMLDPKIGFGQPGPDGKVLNPSVSIRWENVTAEQALGALLKTYNLQMTEDPKTKIALITVKDPAAPDPLITKIIQLKFSHPTNLVGSVQTLFTDKRSKVVPDIRTSQLVVLATEKEMNAVDEMVERLDTQTKQVLIEARLVETSLNPKTTKGFDWTGTLQNQHVRFGNNTPDVIAPTLNAAGNGFTPALGSRILDPTQPFLTANTANGFFPSTFFLNADGVNVVFSFLNSDSETKVLSAPRTVTLDNETATISVTRASPIINVTAGTANTTGGSQIAYTNLGVILNVTPRISANNFVNLRVVPEVSRVFATVSRSVGTIGTFEADEYDIRKMETKVMIPSGNTLVMGGMVQDETKEQNTKVPVLGDIPVLGHLFRSTAKERSKVNLLIFITPTIVTDEDYQPTKSDYLKTPVPTSDSVESEWGAWDSGKPLDWSKPVVERDNTQGHKDSTK